jgi:hypothetical protein
LSTGGVTKAQCNYCNTKLSGASSAGTNHLHQHSNKCISNHRVIVPARQGLLSFTGSAQTTSKRIWVFSQEETQEKLAKMIILHKYPFSIVKHQGFIKLMRTAQPNFTMPGCKAFQSNCIKLFNSMKAQLMQKNGQSQAYLVNH